MIPSFVMNESDGPIPVYLVKQDVCQQSRCRLLIAKRLNIGRYVSAALIFYLPNLKMGVKCS
jgi:hypothetical protein